MNFSIADGVSSPSGTYTAEENINIEEQQPKAATVKQTSGGTPSNQQSGTKT